MGSILSLEKKDNFNDERGDWSLTPETTLTDTTLNIPKKIISNVDRNLNVISKDINTGLTRSYDTLTSTTEDIFQSINKGLKGLLDLSADSIDYAMDKLGLYSLTTSLDEINDLSNTTRERLLYETTSISPQSPKYINTSSTSLDEINDLSDTTKEMLLNKTTSISPQISKYMNTSSTSLDNINDLSDTTKERFKDETTSISSQIPKYKIIEYINSPTSSIQVETQKYIKPMKSENITDTTEINEELQKVIDKKDNIVQEMVVQATQSKYPETKQQSTTISTMNTPTSSLSSLNLSEYNFSTRKFSRF